jgi:hypothetical protein
MVMPPMAFAQSLGYLNQRGGDGAKIEYSSPDGISCRYSEGERPSLALGIGMSEPSQVIPGAAVPLEEGRAIVLPSRQALPQPVYGIVVRVPFQTVKRANCDAFIRLDVAFARLAKAKEMFEDGLITKKQLQAVADAAMAELAR